MVEAEVRPRGPYSLRLSASRVGDATRRMRNGILTAAVDAGDAVELACAWQRPDGAVRIRAESEAGLERLRFCLAVDDDHTPFLERFANDPLVGPATRFLRGMRPLRTATVTHALLRAVVGQLIASRTARAIELTVIRATTPARGGLHAPPTRATLGPLSPAELQRFDLSARKATSLVRLCRSLDLERLRAVPTEAAAIRLERERGIGPWSVGVVCLQGLGRFERGLVGDLGLLKLCAAIRGRWVEADETAELLARYGEWAGLASVYLLAGFGRGLVPVTASLDEVRQRRVRGPLAAA